MNKIINKDCIVGLSDLESNSINCCVTSPPYFGLRDYGVDGQLGLEPTPQEYVNNLVNVFREVRRVLRDDGTVWLNLGDSYAGSGNGGGVKSLLRPDKEVNFGNRPTQNPSKYGLKAKDLIGIPWRVAFALQADGWYLRQDIIWHKPNPMPESVTDRCTKAHEYIFLLSKSPKYYYDHNSIKTPIKETSKKRLSQDIDAQEGSLRVPGKMNGAMKDVGPRFGGNKYGDVDTELMRTKSGNEGANKRSVWTVTTKPFKEAHFATFPTDLIEPCVLAGCPEGGVVLDPFIGAGTTAVVCKSLGRNYIGFEINQSYIEIANKRINSLA